jgi:hypothetical protein
VNLGSEEGFVFISRLIGVVLEFVIACMSSVVCLTVVGCDLMGGYSFFFKKMYFFKEMALESTVEAFDREGAV